MRLVQVCLYADNPDFLRCGKKLRIRKRDQTAQNELGRNDIPPLCCPLAVKHAIKSKSRIFILIHISDSFLEHIP